MKDIKYHFDPQSLTFEREIKPLKVKLIRTGIIAFKALLLTGFVSIFLAFSELSPKLSFLKSENILLTSQYHKVINQLNGVSKDLIEYQNHDEKSYRVYAELTPIPLEIREAGYGGTDQYAGLDGLSQSNIMIEALKKADILLKQLLIQQESYEQIYKSVQRKERQIACTPGLQPISNKDLKRISDIFGMRFHPIFKTRKMHYGIDFSAEIGDPIYCPGDGVVVEVGYEAGYGKKVIVDHGFGIKTLYAHMNDILVRQGDKIKRGQILGRIGDTGTSTGPHLHYEVHINNNPVNPANFYINDLSPNEYDEVIHYAAEHPVKSGS